MLPRCRARGREGEEVAKRTQVLMYHKPSNSGLCGQPQQNSGVVTAGTVQIMFCNDTAMVFGLRQRFSVACFPTGHEFVMFSLRAGTWH